MVPPAICFADGDAFTNCCSAINLSFNGTSLSLNRTNKFWRDFMRTQVSSEDAARIYKSSGGAYDKYDSVAVGVSSAAGGAAIDDGGILAASQAGLTLDSGIAERCKNLYALLEPAPAPAADADAIRAAAKTRILQVSYPVPVAPLNPWRGYSVPSTSPYKAVPLAIPHLSAGGLDFLIEDFDRAFLRRMTNVVAVVGGDAGENDSTSAADYTVEFVEDSAELELKYFRLAHTRALKESYRFNVWQAQTFLSPLRDAALTAVGKDSVTGTAGCQQVAYDETNRTWTCRFSTINLAQVPSFLLISAPRLNDEYQKGAPAVGAAAVIANTSNAIRNKSCNLFIKSLKIQVNNAQGHLDKAGTDNEAFIHSERLFEMTRENAGSHYFKEGGFRAWRDSCMSVLLSSAQFAPGLMVSDGVAYPINVDITMELQNRNVDVSAQQMVGAGGHRILQDLIRAQPQATAIFTKIILATTETSATTNAMNYPLDSAERILNSAGSMR